MTDFLGAMWTLYTHCKLEIAYKGMVAMVVLAATTIKCLIMVSTVTVYSTSVTDEWTDGHFCDNLWFNTDVLKIRMSYEGEATQSDTWAKLKYGHFNWETIKFACCNNSCMSFVFVA